MCDTVVCVFCVGMSSCLCRYAKHRKAMDHYDASDTLAFVKQQSRRGLAEDGEGARATSPIRLPGAGTGGEAGEGEAAAAANAGGVVAAGEWKEGGEHVAAGLSLAQMHADTAHIMKRLDVESGASPRVSLFRRACCSFYFQYTCRLHENSVLSIHTSSGISRVHIIPGSGIGFRTLRLHFAFKYGNHCLPP